MVQKTSGQSKSLFRSQLNIDDASDRISQFDVIVLQHCISFQLLSNPTLKCIRRVISDDTIDGYQGDINDFDTSITDYRFYNAPGADGVWYTHDDIVNRYLFRTRNSYRQPLSRFSGTDLGVDGLPATMDDGPDAVYQVYRYAENGNRQDDTRYDSPGPDLLWHTDDDSLRWFQEYYTEE